ncbi:transcriptional regulator [Shewanella sairae]|uniref:Transcriptional regulator n=1 Tax=Shewanella sairae TaxID=190310 RepID=A0ABQ4PQM3_9GAMM|nr:DNA-binding protein [Shewanella sairae]MCL1132365.1 DNA-binding protein [Shewanella sairae]GIU51534.1 transcriptional regulator [Shewanella sairae]
MSIKPIKTESDNKAALERIEQLWDAQPNTPEGDELDVLVTLVQAFEEIHYPISAPDPVEAIRFRMEQAGLEDADLVPYLGQRSRVSEVLSYKRRLSIGMIRKLNEGLKIPLESLIRDYQLAR